MPLLNYKLQCAIKGQFLTNPNLHAFKIIRYRVLVTQQLEKIVKKIRNTSVIFMKLQQFMQLLRVLSIKIQPNKYFCNKLCTKQFRIKFNLLVDKAIVNHLVCNQLLNKWSKSESQIIILWIVCNLLLEVGEPKEDNHLMSPIIYSFWLVIQNLKSQINFYLYNLTQTKK